MEAAAGVGREAVPHHGGVVGGNLKRKRVADEVVGQASKPSAHRVRTAALSTMLAWCVYSGLLKQNAVVGLKSYGSPSSLPSSPRERIRWLFVIARNSSFTYKGRVADVKVVGRELRAIFVPGKFPLSQLSIFTDGLGHRLIEVCSLETSTYCPPTANRGSDLVSVSSAMRRDGARFQAIRLPRRRSRRDSAARWLGRLHSGMDDRGACLALRGDA
jgi:hypothetical protein